MSPIKKLLKPDTTEVLLYLSIGFGLLVLNNIQKFWAYLASGASHDEVIDYSDVAFNIKQMLIDFEASIDPRLADLTVWLIVGAVSIGIILIAQKVLVDSGEDLKRAAMLRKTHFGRITSRETAYRIALRAAGALLFLIWARIFFGSIFSYFSDLFLSSIIDIFSFKIVFLPISLMAVALGVYIFIVCSRLIALRVRILK